jgi:glycosyltransferase involved in cell wall biosynthesis
MRVAVHAGQLLQAVPGGIGRYEVALLGRLASHGVEAVAFGAGARPQSLHPDVPWLDLGRPRGSLRYELWHRLQRPVVRVAADLVHAPSLAVPPVGDRPLVVTVHDVAFLRLPHATTRRGARFHTRGLELARRHASVVISPSQFTARELEREGFTPDRIAVVPFGVDTPWERDAGDIAATIARAGVQPPYVLTVGTIEPRKDLPTLVAAVERVRATHADLTLVVTGPRGWGDVRGLDRPFVRVVGEQPWPVVDALYRSAAVCCVASLYEGFGLPVVEAMARRIPVVATKGSSLEELVTDAGLLFAPGDVDGCAQQLASVLSDTDLHARLQETSAARAAELTWSRCVAAHAEAYARVSTAARS